MVYFIELLVILLNFTYLQVLSACSPYFRQLFMASPAQHQTVFIKVRLEQSGRTLFFPDTVCLHVVYFILKL